MKIYVRYPNTLINEQKTNENNKIHIYSITLKKVQEKKQNDKTHYIWENNQKYIIKWQNTDYIIK